MENIKFDNNGLIPAITQDYKTKQVLMLAYMNKEALNKTIETKKVHYFSRSRNELWLKGETSGNYQLVKGITYDCDKDTILIQIEQIGTACHTGHYSCFYNNVDHTENSEIIKEPEYFDARALKEEYNTIVERKNNPKEDSYTNYLIDKGIDKILKKVGEEASEFIIAIKNNDSKEIISETADLLYHIMVAMVETNVTWEDIFEEIKSRK